MHYINYHKIEGERTLAVYRKISHWNLQNSWSYHGYFISLDGKKQ